MSAAQGFVAKYVKDLALDDQRREAMLTNLKEGRPFVEEERMTVAIIDVSGYSALASFLEQKLGKLSSEVMTSAVGDYMAKIAEVLYRYQGDIVKFLGDALLVTFSSNSPVEAADAISMRALTCCLEILKRYPVYEIDLNEWSQVLKVSQAAANVNPSAIETNSTNVLDTAAKPLLTKDTITKTKSLTLHIGVTRGMVERVVLGIPGRRMDYLVHGECLASLGAMLDSTKSGELGLDIDLLSLIKIDDVYSHISSDKFAVLRKNDVAQLSSNIQEERPNRRRSSIVDPPDTIKRKSSRSSISGVERSNSVTRPARCMSAFHTDNIPEVATELIKNFVNRSILFRLNEVLAPLKTEPGKKTETVRDVGREKRPTNTLRKHSVVARSEGAQAAGLIRTEYRTVSVMFLKVHGRFAADIAQTLFVKLLEQLDLFNGVFQQYSVDDKGQGMLACFGLPPFVSDKCGLIAVKAAARFAQTLSTEELCNISIAVTTGDILFGTVGWEYRRDAALLGDAVNVAARLLSIDRAIILLDDRTKEVVRETFSVTDLGFVKVKGKSRPINVWSISNFNVSTAQATNLSVSWTQNKKERQILDQYTKMWKEARKQKSFFLVEGDSGMGKSTLLGFVQKLFKEQSVLSCIARGSEVDQLNSFIAVRDVFVQILQIRVSFANSRNSSITISTIKTGRPSFIDTHSPTLDKVDFESILREANEDPTFASLLHALVKGETVIENTGDSGDHNASTPILDKRRSISTPVNDDARRRALKFVLVRIISYLCTKYKIAILLDDSQWVDESSLEVFYMIADSHQEILMAIFTRPIRNVDSTSFLHRFLSLGSLYHLPLTGMSLEDLKSILVEYMKARSVESNLLNEIYRQTNGNLLQTESLLRYLLEKSDEIVYLDKDKQLCGRSAETLQVAVSRSVEAVIMSQFDSLHSDYQHVLRYASILGQYLDLHELTFLLENETFRPEDIRSLIAIHDQFEFLRPCTEGAIADSSAGAYYFRHISIMNAIYQSVSFTEREELHLQIAEHLDYVVKTNPGRKEQTLPAICYHYWRARDAAKILQRVSELGFDCMKNNLPMEARKSLQNVHDYLDENRINLEAALGEEDRHLLDPIFQCKILANLAITKASLRDLKGAIEAAVKCITFAGFDWPTMPKPLKKIILKFARRSVSHWWKSGGGRRDIRLSPTSPKELQPDWFPIIRTALDALLLVATYAALDKQHIVVVVFWSLSQAYVTCETDPTYYFKILFWACWMFALQGSSIALNFSARFIRRCQSLQPLCDSSITTLFHMYPAMLFTYTANTRETLDMIRKYEDYWLERRVKLQQFKAFLFYAIFSVYNGNMTFMKSRLTDEWAAEMKNIDILWYCAVTGVYQLECFLKSDRESLEKFSQRQKEVHHLVPTTALIRLGSSVRVNDVFVLVLRQSSGNVLLEASSEALGEILDTGVTTNYPLATAAALSVCISTLAVCTVAVQLKAGPITRLSESIDRYIKALKVLSKYSWMGKLATLLSLAAKYHLMGKPSQIVTEVRKFMNLAELTEKLDMGGDLCFIGALCCGIISLSSLDEAEVRSNRNRAISMFEEMGAETMLKWVTKELEFETLIT